MNVVTYVEASKLAGVSKQAIGSLRKANEKLPGRYRFFIHDPITGRPGIDVDHPDWRAYLSRNQTQRKRTPEPTVEPPPEIPPEARPYLDWAMPHLLSAVDSAVTGILNTPAPLITEIRADIVRRYSEMVGE